MRIPHPQKGQKPVRLSTLFLAIFVFAGSAGVTLGVMQSGDQLSYSPTTQSAMSPGDLPEVKDSCEKLLEKSKTTKDPELAAEYKRLWRDCVQKACPAAPTDVPGTGEQYCAGRANKGTCEKFCIESANTMGAIDSCCKGGPQEKVTCPNMVGGKCYKGPAKWVPPKKETPKTTPKVDDPKNKTPDPDPKAPDKDNKDGGDKKGGGGGMPEMPKMPESKDKGGGGPQPPPTPPLPPPTCTIYATRSSIKPGESTTLHWNSAYTQSASLSGIGTVEVAGSRAVSPSVTTNYTLTVEAPRSPETNQNLFTTITDFFTGGGGSGGKTATCSVTVNVTTTTPPPPPPPPPPPGCNPPAKPSDAECTKGSWQPRHNDAGCLIGWRCTEAGDTSTSTPKGSVSCRPTKADVGSEVTIEFRCENSSESVGNGFSTGGAIFGTSTVVVKELSLSEGDRNSYVLTCKNGSGKVHASSCAVELNRPKIVLTANPKTIEKNSTTKIGWVTTGMRSCVISSPELRDFTSDNAERKNVNGTVRTPKLKSTTDFVLTCTTDGGSTRSGTTTVKVR